MNGVPRALLVDLDGVMVDTESPALAALTQTFAAYGAEVEPNEVDRRFRGQNLDLCHDQLSRTFSDYARALIGRRTPGHVFGCSADELSRTYRVFRSALDDEPEPTAVPPGFVAESRRRAHDGPAPEAEPGACRLLRVSVPRRIVTNSSAVAAARTLAGAGLDEAIAPHDVISVDRVEHGKPAPNLYLTAAAELGLAPQDCLAVEDSLTGLRAAQAAGVPAVGYAPTPEHRRILEAAGFPTITDLAALVELVS